MKKLAIIIIFLGLVLFLYEVPLKNFVKRGKTKDITNTLKILEEACDAIETYIIEWGKIPQANSYSELSKMMKELYERDIPLKDSWGNPLSFKKEKNSYEIISPGKDKKINTSDDIIFKDGDFKVNSQNKILEKIIKKYTEEGN